MLGNKLHQKEEKNYELEDRSCEIIQLDQSTNQPIKKTEVNLMGHFKTNKYLRYEYSKREWQGRENLFVK